ncbi:MAG: fibronectin type III domain-containing protein [Candidatus Brocadiales bacterium]|nr:fibronectin type III domain-containing protein [Candidatus Brocadiales bacterium]
MRLPLLLLSTLLTVLSCNPCNHGALAQGLELILPEGFKAFDTPNDSGETISLTWKVSPSESTDIDYIIYLSPSTDGPWQEAVRFRSDTHYKSDAPELFGFRKKLRNSHFLRIEPRRYFPGKENKKAVYYFKLAMARGEEVVPQGEVVSARAKGNWFDLSKLNNLIIMVSFSGIVLFFIAHARRFPHLFVRRISGLDAVDEALGRATEMGRPALFVHGLTGMGSISTMAAVNILGRIARKVAEYDTILKVVNNDPIVLSVSQEVVKESYLEAGRPDAYNQDNVVLVASEQFPYVVAVGGIMTRERTAANFFVGFFYAESLILAETGAATGAIQVAATDSYTQLPFFITTCDYTLMGEELYAASAYLSREPMLLGSLRAQDLGKAIIILVLFFGTILASFGIEFITQVFRAF